MKKKYNKRNLPALYERLIKAQYISHSGVWAYLPDKDIFIISGFICNILGMERSEEVLVSRKKMKQSLERLGLHEEEWSDFFKKESFDFRLQVKTEQGIRTYRLVSEYPDNPDNRGNIIEGVITDITDYMKMDKLILESQKLMQETQRFARVGSFRWEMDLERIWGSEMFFELLGLTPDVNNTLSVSEFIFAFQFIDGGDFHSFIDEGKTHGNVFSTRVKCIKGGTKEDIFFGLKGHCFFVNNKAIRVEGTIHDITERYRSQQMLYQKDQAEALGHLVSGVVHDFNNILTGIIGYTELINKEVQGNKNLESGKYCDGIFKTCDKATMNIERLLHFSGKKEISRVPVHLHDVLTRSKTILENWQELDLVPEFDLGAENDFIEGDDIALQNLIINLAMNSEESVSAEGIFFVSTKNITLDKQMCNELRLGLVPGEYILIQVADSGKGISKENLSKIFDPFFTSKKTGVGVGLPTSLDVVISHDGAMKVESSLGEGTLVSIYLPVKIFSEAPCLRLIDPGFSKDDKFPENSGTVLVVEDESILRDIARHILENIGCKTIFGENGRIGIEKYLEHREEIDLVLLDVIMPELDGSETLVKLKKINPDIKVIMVSGFTEDSSIQQFFDLGAVGFITKPYRRYEIEGMVTKFLPLKKD